MNVLIIDQCSGSKDYRDSSPVLDEEKVDSTSRTELVETDGVVAKRAKDLYSGRQQALIDEATNILRESGTKVDRYFISAGFGLVEESTLLPPYEVTFSSMSNEEIRNRSEALRIQEDLIDVVADGGYDFVFLPLGKDYYTALDLPEIIEQMDSNTIIVVFNRKGTEAEYENVLSLSARTDEAREFGVIVIELKGKLIKNFAERDANGELIVDLENVREACTYNPQGDLGSFSS